MLFSAAKRLQFSLEVKRIPEVKIMKKMPDVILPLFWVEEGAHLGRKYTAKLGGTVLMYVSFLNGFLRILLHEIQLKST